MNELFKRIQDLLVDKLGVEECEVVPNARLKEDLGMDSLDGIEVIMALEYEFSISIDDEEAERFITVQDLVNSVQAKQ